MGVCLLLFYLYQKELVRPTVREIQYVWREKPTEEMLQQVDSKAYVLAALWSTRSSGWTFLQKAGDKLHDVTHTLSEGTILVYPNHIQRGEAECYIYRKARIEPLDFYTWQHKYKDSFK